MRAKGISFVLAAALSIGSASAKTFTWNPDFKVAFDLGTTGIGFELESSLNDYLQVRTGFDWMPHFEYPMHFSVQVGDGSDPEKFDRMAGYLKDMTGFEIDQTVDMIGVPNYYNFKLLFDVFPFENKHWYFTAGFYAGPSTIGKAYNRTEDMTTLLAVAMYNNIFDKVWAIEYDPECDLDGVFLGLELPPMINDKFLNAGRMGMRVGDFPDGTSYVMEPDKDNMVKAEMKVNSFKPYLGAGYNGFLDKNNERLKFAVDAGVMFWGGTPKVYTHENVEIVQGLDNVIGQVGKYTKLIKPMKVFPVINFSISYRLFKK